MAESLRVGSVGELQLDLVWQLGDVPAMASWAPMSQQAAWHLHTLMPEEEPAFAFLQVPPLAAALLPQLERTWLEWGGVHALWQYRAWVGHSALISAGEPSTRG